MSQPSPESQKTYTGESRHELAGKIPEVVLEKLYTSTLVSYPRVRPVNYEPLIKLKCTQCDYKKNETWPVNSRDLRLHWMCFHPDLYGRKRRAYEDGTGEVRMSRETSVESSSRMKAAAGFLTPSNTVNALRLREIVKFDEEYYRKLTLNLMVMQDLPFTFVE